MKLYIGIFLLALTSLAYCAEEDVLVLTDSNFESSINGADLMLVEFYAPWCGHCKSLAPKYAEAAGILKKNDPSVPIAKVDCTVETATCSKYGVSGYPTLKVFKSGTPSDYKGGRETNAIVSYMKKNVGPIAKTLATLEEAKQFISQVGDISIVGIFPTKNAAAEEFLKVAGAIRDEFKYLAYVTEQSIADALGLGNGGVAVFRSSEKDPEVYSGSGSLSDWIYERAVAFPGELTKDNAQRYLRTKLPVLKLYTDVNWKSNLKQTTYWMNRLKKIAQDTFNGKLLFALVDKATHSDETAKFGITKFPAIAIDDATNSQKYRFAEDFNIEKAVEWAKDVIEGKVKSYIKSEPTPTQDGPVTIVTGETFKDIVLDDTKDVLLEIYAPWCGHCKNLVPIYDELATSLKDVDNVVIAKMDATANDSPHGKYQAKGYPTILFAPAGSKDAPVAYSGARDVKSFTEFLKKESKNSNFNNRSASKAEL